VASHIFFILEICEIGLRRLIARCKYHALFCFKLFVFIIDSCPQVYRFTFFYCENRVHISIGFLSALTTQCIYCRNSFIRLVITVHHCSPSLTFGHQGWESAFSPRLGKNQTQRLPQLLQLQSCHKVFRVCSHLFYPILSYSILFYPILSYSIRDSFNTVDCVVYITSDFLWSSLRSVYTLYRLYCRLYCGLCSYYLPCTSIVIICQITNSFVIFLVTRTP